MTENFRADLEPNSKDSGAKTAESASVWNRIVSGELFDLPESLKGLNASKKDSEPKPESSEKEPVIERVSGRYEGNNDALIAEGTRLYRAGKLADSFAYFLQAARQGDARAQLQVGFCYEEGLGVDKDYNMAASWYKASAENGNTQAMKNLGQMLEYGAGINEDWKEAAKWYERAANAGHVDAMAALARAYQFGVGVPQSRQAALYWDKKAYQSGHTASLEWIRKLSNPLNNIGFRSDEEHELVIGDKLRTSGLLLGADPAGIAFGSSAERIEWLKKLAAGVEQDERNSSQYQRQWQWQRNNEKSPFVPNPWQGSVDPNRELYINR